jgi:hypothetical protein
MGVVVIGLALLAYAVLIGFAPAGCNWVGWIGVIPLLTAAFGFCPLYTLLDVSLVRRKAPPDVSRAQIGHRTRRRSGDCERRVLLAF